MNSVSSNKRAKFLKNISAKFRHGRCNIIKILFNFIEILKRIENTIVDKSELDGALDGVLRMQDTYRLNASDIARGLLQDVQYE